MYYVYIIQSKLDQSYNKGHTQNYFERLVKHNNLESTYTKRKAPWKLVYLEIYTSRREALMREKSLKKYSNSQIENLINSPNNKHKTLVDEWLKSIPNPVGD